MKIAAVLNSKSMVRNINSDLIKIKALEKLLWQAFMLEFRTHSEVLDRNAVRVFHIYQYIQPEELSLEFATHLMLF